MSDEAAEPDGRIKRLVGGAGWQTLAQVAPLFVNLLLTPFVITHLGRELYALWIVTSTFVQFMAQFDGGIGRSALRYFTLLAAEQDRRGMASHLVTLLIGIIGVTAITLLPFYFLAPVVADFFHAPAEQLGPVQCLLQVLVFMVGLSLARNLFASVLLAHHRFAYNAINLLIGYAVYAVGMWYVVGQGLGLVGIAYVYIAQQVAATLLIVPASLRHLDFRGLRLLRRSQIRDFVRFAVKLQASGILSMLSAQGVTLIVARLAPGQVADFTPGATFAQQLRTLPMNALVPAQSTLGHALVAEPGRAPEVFRRIQRLWVVLVCGWVAVGAPATYVGVNVWLPLGGDLAGRIAATLLVGHLLALLPLVLTSWAMLQGFPEVEMWGNVVTVAVTLACAFVLVGPLGAWGVALGVPLAQACGLATMLVLVRRRLEVTPHSPLTCIPVVATLAAALAASLAAWGMHTLVELGHVPRGALGLVACGLPAGVVLVAYFGATLGLRRSLGLIRQRLPRK